MHGLQTNLKLLLAQVRRIQRQAILESIVNEQAASEAMLEALKQVCMPANENSL